MIVEVGKLHCAALVYHSATVCKSNEKPPLAGVEFFHNLVLILLPGNNCLTLKKYTLPPGLRYLWYSYLLGLAFFTGFRLLLLCLNLDSLQSLPAAGSLLIQSLFMGFRFDTVISCYLLALPLLLLCLADMAAWYSRRFLLWIHWFLNLLYAACFFAAAADIPFYNNYHARLNGTVLTWTATPGFMIKMVLQERAFLVYLILFLVVLILFLLLRRRLFRRQAELYTGAAIPGKKRWVKGVFSVLALLLLFLGIRGRTTLKTPIQVGTAFFSPYNFPNQLGLNPMFTFIRSYLDGKKEENKYLQLMDEQEALSLMKQYLHVPEPEPYPGYPLARLVSATGPVADHYNVVLVLMESMSAAYLQRYGNTEKLTPYLDELAGRSYCFDHFYSAGLHTYNGIFSTLYGMPALLARHSMYADVIPECTGLPYVLQQNGYRNSFFLTHDDQFDNIGPFLRVNHFNEVIGQKDYPASEVISTLGIPDHLLFRHVLEHLDTVAVPGRPFFTAVMTGTNHNPYEVPDGIPLKTRGKYQREGCVEYADWSIRQFMQEAAQKDWYRNTVFVFLGDHGAIRYDDMYADVSYSYSHIPLLVHIPGAQAMPVTAPGSQPDVFPTLCGMLGLSYINNSMGIDLLREHRPFTAFSADDKAAVTDNKYIYVWHRDGRENMFVLGKSFTEDILSEQRVKADSMKHYLLGVTQAAQWMLANGKAGSPPGSKVKNAPAL